MILNIEDKHTAYFHGITIVDEACQPINFIKEFDTETLLCRVGPLGKVVVAAAFVIIPQPRIYDYLPEGLYPFVIPIKNPGPDRVRAFLMNLLETRGRFKASTFTYEDMKQEKNVEETFNWPRDAFVGLAKTVIPSEEKEAQAEAEYEKRKWEGGVVAHENVFDIIGKVTLPWNEEVELTNENKPEFSSLWLRSKDDGLVSWGAAVKPPCNFAIPNSLLNIHMIGGLGLMEGNHDDVPSHLWKPLYEKTWRVISTRGKPNGTVELMFIEHPEKSPLGNLPSFVPEGKEKTDDQG